ncbi:MAG: sugar ABC transporter ATP-binding protein [Candidatus Dormibacteraceae bacterium]
MTQSAVLEAGSRDRSSVGPLLEVRELSKRYGQTQALNRVNLTFQRHEVQALLGENGAGKSTLVQILRGNTRADEGELRIDGQVVELSSPADADRFGIAAVYQELSLLPNLTIAQNLSIERVPLGRGFLGRLIGMVDDRELTRRADDAARRLGESWNADDLVSSLSISQKQRLEITRAVSRDSRILILDEPTSSLAPDDREQLFAQIRTLRDAGIAIIFITHNIEEALEVSDLVTVLRDGRSVGTRRSADATVADIVELMTGRVAGTLFPRRDLQPRSDVPRLALRNLSAEPFVKDVSFDVFPGEIVGLAGLVGSGRSKLLRCIYGMLPRTGGEILLDGSELRVRSPLQAIAAGVGLIPEDRQAEGLFPSQSVFHNIVVLAAVLAGDSKQRFLLSTARLRRLASAMIQRLDIKVASMDVRASHLSGGNQQKLILARWLAIHPKLILADEPTRGVSIGSKSEIYRTFRALTAESVSIVLVSSEFDELIGLCDRIILIRDGVSVGEASSKVMTEDDLLHLLLAATPDQVRSSQM